MTKHRAAPHYTICPTCRAQMSPGIPLTDDQRCGLCRLRQLQGRPLDAPRRPIGTELRLPAYRPASSYRSPDE